MKAQLTLSEISCGVEVPYNKLQSILTEAQFDKLLKNAIKHENKEAIAQLLECAYGFKHHKLAKMMGTDRDYDLLPVSAVISMFKYADKEEAEIIVQNPSWHKYSQYVCHPVLLAFNMNATPEERIFWTALHCGIPQYVDILATFGRLDQTKFDTLLKDGSETVELNKCVTTVYVDHIGAFLKYPQFIKKYNILHLIEKCSHVSHMHEIIKHPKFDICLHKSGKLQQHIPFLEKHFPDATLQEIVDCAHDCLSVACHRKEILDFKDYKQVKQLILNNIDSFKSLDTVKAIIEKFGSDDELITALYLASAPTTMNAIERNPKVNKAIFSQVKQMALI